MVENNIDKIYEKKKLPQELVALFVILIISSCALYFIVMPMRREVEIKKMEIEIKEENIKSREFQLKRIKNIDNIENEENYLKNIGKIKNLISVRDNYEDYLAHIEKLAKSNGVLIKDLSISDKKNTFENDKVENNIKSKNINFSTLGNFVNFVRFLEEVEKSIPFMQVNSISMGVEKNLTDEDDENNLPSFSFINFNINISFLHY